MRTIFTCILLIFLCSSCVSFDPEVRKQEAFTSFSDQDLVSFYESVYYPSMLNTQNKLHNLRAINYRSDINPHYLGISILYMESIVNKNQLEDTMYQESRSLYIDYCKKNNLEFKEYKPKLTEIFYNMFKDRLPDTVWLSSVRVFMPDRMIISYKDNIPSSALIFYTRTSANMHEHDLYTHSYAVILNKKDTNMILDYIGNSSFADTEIRY